MIPPAASTVFVALVTCFAGSRMARAAGAPTTRPVVIVELFTSEGCSSCPPADAVLADLSKPDAVDGVEIVPLELHVDYWNHGGWADPFSSAQFTRRQEDYARAFRNDQIYTPQMIVDGAQELVGSDKKKALAAIARSAKQAKGNVVLEVSPVSKDGKSAVCQITISGVPKNAGGYVMLAITEDELSTDVPRGENARRKLQHATVVRELKDLGTIKPGGSSPFSARTTIGIMPSWRVERLRVAVFVQEKEAGRILAAGRAAIKAAGSTSIGAD